jgi:hypothetical protein
MFCWQCGGGVVQKDVEKMDKKLDFRAMMKIMKNDLDWIKNIDNRDRFVTTCRGLWRDTDQTPLEMQADFASLFGRKHIGTYSLMARRVKATFGEEKCDEET